MNGENRHYPRLRWVGLNAVGWWNERIRKAFKEEKQTEKEGGR